MSVGPWTKDYLTSLACVIKCVPSMGTVHYHTRNDFENAVGTEEANAALVLLIDGCFRERELLLVPDRCPNFSLELRRDLPNPMLLRVFHSVL